MKNKSDRDDLDPARGIIWNTLASVVILLVVFWAVSANATGGRTDDPDISVDQDQGQEQDQQQDQQQEQDQDQSQEQVSTQSSDQSNAQSLSISARNPGRAYVGGGNSTASDQKVFAVSGGWLTGAAGIRLDRTDKDARKLRIANEWRGLGRYAAADELECSIRLVYKAVGGNPDKCYDILAGSNTEVNRTSYNRRYEDELEDLRREIDRLREEDTRNDEACQRRWESCVQKAPVSH